MPSFHESNTVFYIDTSKIITSRWKKSKASLGTQRILLNIICDLIQVVRGRGVFSDFSYPDPITDMFLDIVGNMLCGYAGPGGHIRGAVSEMRALDSKHCVDMGLRRKVLTVLIEFQSTRN